MKPTKEIFCFLILSIIITGCQQNQAPEQKTRPNIVYIFADDLGYGDLGCFGQEMIKTPEIDKMAAEGMRFTQHYAGNTVCAPSRCSLMTGIHQGHATIRGNGCTGGCPIRSEDKTVAEYLKEAGYITGLIGKWGLGDFGTEGFPTKQGFDYFYGYDNQIYAHNYWPEFLWRNNQKDYLSNKVQYLDSNAWHQGKGSYSTVKSAYSHDLFTMEALTFLQKHQDTSFFLYLPFTIPHNNGEAPKGFKQEVPDYGIYDKQEWETDTKGYAAMISRLDESVGLIISQLEELGLAENTLVIFDSDNGPMQADQHYHNKFFNSNANLRGGKRDLYEGGIRVPMIAWWPGKIDAGQVSDHVNAAYDFLPTATQIAGVNIAENIDGISFLPILLGQEQEQHEYLYWEFSGAGYQQAIRMGNWKAVRTDLEKNPEAPFELYNLADDPDESENIAAKHPDVIKNIEQIAAEAHVPNKRFPAPWEKEQMSLVK